MDNENEYKYDAIMEANTNKLIHGDYKFLLDYFKEEVLSRRYDLIHSYLEKFIKIRNLQDDIIISSSIVENLVVDYFVDVYRIKKFQGIEIINDEKIYSYTAYWMLRRKPLQLIKPDLDNKYSFINEEMVASYLYSFLFSEPSNVVIVPEKKDTFNEFENNLLYSFMYREINPQMIESLIYAFKAGRSYQYSIDFK